ncbi:MAG TPA: PadR family transcriptional regulator [Dehalococcoidia bacterium]|nr:PadR family transcriptional regulator [Dehalococcoidia bacterium]
MRRKKGTLLPLEVSILQCGIDFATRGAPRFHGFLIAKEMKDRDGAKLLTAHGTLYKALDRLQKSGFLESDWEDPLLAAQQGRPRRRLYHVTAAGEAALVEAIKAPQQAAPATPIQERRPGIASV